MQRVAIARALVNNPAVIDVYKRQAVGTGAGVAIGHKLDKKAAEAAKIEGAQVEKVTDTNGLAAVKVTFESGILFGFNSSTDVYKRQY